MFKLSPASLQTIIDTPNCVLEDRVQYSTVHIPNVFCDGHVHDACVLYCSHQVHKDFLISLYKPASPRPAIQPHLNPVEFNEFNILISLTFRHRASSL